MNKANKNEMSPYIPLHSALSIFACANITVLLPSNVSGVCLFRNADRKKKFPHGEIKFSKLIYSNLNII